MNQPSQQLDYPSIAEKLSVASIVGLGESTHGTHEFFQAKTDIFKELVRSHGFNTFFLESIDDVCERVDVYIQTGEGDPEELVNKLFYVYRTEELLELVLWLRENHEQYPVRFIGVDERKYVEDYAVDYNQLKVNQRDKRMALVVKNYAESNPGTKGVIWAHDSHVATYLNQPEMASDTSTRHIAMGENLRSWLGKSYYSVSQLFGSGYFNAALINESGTVDSGRLVPHYAHKASKWFWEKRFIKEISEPTFLQGPAFGGLVKPDEILYKRALGWGVKRSVMHDQNNVTYTNMSRTFDAVIFFPKATASHLLTNDAG